MDRNEIEKFRRHMGAGRYIKIKNDDGGEDEFYFKPLGCKYLPDFLQIASALDYNPDQKREISELKIQLRQGKITQDQLNNKLEGYDAMNETKIFEENKTWTIAGIIAAVGVVLVLILFKDEVDRFTFIMPIFAAFIVVGILTLADEEEKKEKKS